MAIATTTTLIPLDNFAKIFGVNPLHFNQVQVDNLSVSHVCDSPLVQHAWQDADRASREELAIAIADAENLIAQAVGFKLAPTWEINDKVLFPRPARAEVFSSGIVDIRGLNQGLRTNWKRVIEGGIKAISTISLNAPIVFSDLDGDTYFETATITVATSVTDPEEVHIFYPGKGGGEEYEIRPITVTIVAGTATITCRRELLVQLGLMESFTARAVDGLIDANFINTVDVYRIFNSEVVEAQFVWNDNSGCGSCAACINTYQNACLTVNDGETGLVRLQPAEWNVVTEQYDATALNACRAPDSVRLFYRAGWQRGISTINMDPQWQRAVCYYAAAQLHRPLCACASVTNYMEYWQEDLALRQASPSGSQSFNFNTKQFENPFGTRRGHIYAWRLAQRFLGSGVNA